MGKKKPFLKLKSLVNPHPRFERYAHVMFEAYPHPDLTPESLVQLDSMCLDILVKLNEPPQDEADIISEAWSKVALRFELLTGLAKNRAA